MKEKIIYLLFLIICLSCNHSSDTLSSKKNDGNEAEIDEPRIKEIIIPKCNDLTILKILENEPAIVRYWNCISILDRTGGFVFELEKRHDEFFGLFLCPFESIPNEYRKDGLSVYINGKVTSCGTCAGCSEPNIKLASMQLFELKCINIQTFF